jgi:hypothetical protein
MVREASRSWCSRLREAYVEEEDVAADPFPRSGRCVVGHGDGGEGRRRQEVLVSVGFLAE